MFSRFALLTALVCGFLGTLSSCSKKPPAQDLYELSQQTKFEGVSLHLQISQSSLKTNERARVILDIKHDPSLEITLPNLDGQFGDFTFAEVITPPAKLDSQSWVHRHISFLIEPDLPGESTLLPFEFIVENPDGEISKIQTQPVAIQVLSVGVDADTQLRDIAPDERDSLLPSNSNAAIAWIIAALALVAVGIFIFIRTSQSPEMISTQSLDEFLALGECSSEQIINQIEPLFCQAYSAQTGLNKQCADFDSLCRELTTPPTELADLVSRYESAQYGKKILPEDEIRDIYQQLSKLLDTDFRKVVR
jgi:hypothetical protein